MASIVPPVPMRHDADAEPAPAPGPAPIVGSEPRSSSSPSVMSKTSFSEHDFPGAFPRDPRVALDRLSDQAVTTDSANSGTMLGAAREDVRHAVDMASRYLPGSIVGALGYVLPAGTITTDEADKKLDPGQASQMGLASKQTLGGLDSSDMAVAGIASDLSPSTNDSPASPSAAAGGPQSSSSPDFDTEGDANAPKSPLSEGLSNTYAPANFASESSLDTSSVPPESMPSPGAEDVEGKVKEDEDKPAFATYAPAPVITGSETSIDRSNTPPATQQFTAPSVAKALDSTAPKNQSSEDPAGSPTSVPHALSSKDKGKDSNTQPAFATYAPAPIITGSQSSLDASGNNAPAKTTDSSGGAIGERQASASQPSLDTAQNLPGSTDAQEPAASGPTKDKKDKKAYEAAALGTGVGTLGGAAYESSGSPAQASARGADQAPFADSAAKKQTPPAAYQSSSDPATRSQAPAVASRDFQEPAASAPTKDSKEKKAAEAAALGAGIGTLGGATYASSRKPEQGPVRNDDQAPFDNSATANPATRASSHVPSDTATPAPVPSRASRDFNEKRPVDDEKNFQDSEKDGAAAAVGVGADDKKAERDASKVAEKEKHREEEEAAAAAAAAEAAHKKEQKEAHEREKEEKRQQKEAEKEAEKEQHRREKETAAAEAADRKAQKEAKERQREAEKEQHRKDKEAKEKQKAEKRQEKEAAAAALAADKEAQKEAKERAKERQAEKEMKEEENQEGTPENDEKHTNKDPAEAAAATLAAASAERERKRHSQEDPVSSATRQRTSETRDVSKGPAAAPTAVSGTSADNAPGTPSINPARPGATALGGTKSEGSYDPAKSGADSDFPLPSANASKSSGIHAIDLNGKGTGTAPSAAAGKTAPLAGDERTRYHGTEGLQEKHEGGALRSNTINRSEGDGNRKAKAQGEGDNESDASADGNGEGKKEGRVKQFMEKVKDKLHHHGN